MKLLSTADQSALAAFCVLYGRWVNGEKQVQQNGTIVKSPDKGWLQRPRGQFGPDGRCEHTKVIAVAKGADVGVCKSWNRKCNPGIINPRSIGAVRSVLIRRTAESASVYENLEQLTMNQNETSKSIRWWSIAVGGVLGVCSMLIPLFFRENEIAARIGMNSIVLVAILGAIFAFSKLFAARETEFRERLALKEQSYRELFDDRIERLRNILSWRMDHSEETPFVKHCIQLSEIYEKVRDTGDDLLRQAFQEYLDEVLLVAQKANMRTVPAYRKQRREFALKEFKKKPQEVRAVSYLDFSFMTDEYLKANLAAAKNKNNILCRRVYVVQDGPQNLIGAIDNIRSQIKPDSQGRPRMEVRWILRSHVATDHRNMIIFDDESMTHSELEPDGTEKEGVICRDTAEIRKRRDEFDQQLFDRANELTLEDLIDLEKFINDQQVIDRIGAITAKIKELAENANP